MVKLLCGEKDMIEVSINYKLNKKKLDSLLTFLFSIADQVCFSTFHNYHIDEDVSVEIINEYKERCKEKHRQLTMWYEKKDKTFSIFRNRYGFFGRNIVQLGQQVCLRQ